MFTANAQASEENDVRGLVQQTFQQLQSRNYSAVYDSLPSATQKRMSRARFTNALQRAQGRYTLDRISIGTVRVAGDLAVADTELFGRVMSPIAAEGKIVVQQYLVREGGKWRVATGDNANDSTVSENQPRVRTQISYSSTTHLREAGRSMDTVVDEITASLR